MKGILTEAVRFNGLTLESGTPVYFERNQAQNFDNLHPRDHVVASVALGYYLIKIMVKKSQVYLEKAS